MGVGEWGIVFRNDDRHPDKNGNQIWDGKTIRMSGLYNEVLAFQIVVKTEKQGAAAVEISMEAPHQKISGKVMGGNTLKYGPAGTIEIYSQPYLQVNDSTPPNWYYDSLAGVINVFS